MDAKMNRRRTRLASPQRTAAPEPEKPLTAKARAIEAMKRAARALNYHDRLRAIRFVHRARVALDIDGSGRSMADALHGSVMA